MTSKSPSLGIAGWSDPEVKVLDYAQIQKDKAAKEAPLSACWAFGKPPEVDNEVEDSNVQVAWIICALGDTGAGRRAIIKAIAERQGIVDVQQLEQMYSGKSDIKLRVPKSLRSAMGSIGLGEMLAPVNVMTIREGDSILVNEDA